MLTIYFLIYFYAAVAPSEELWTPIFNAMETILVADRQPVGTRLTEKVFFEYLILFGRCQAPVEIGRRIFLLGDVRHEW